MAEAYKLKQRKLDARTALICASIYNAQRTKKDKLIKPEQFMPKEEKKEKQQKTPREMLRAAEEWIKVTGGKDLRRDVNDDTC